jgi:predicted TPR repeat methyltransferase
VSGRLPDAYFADLYAQSADPWALADRWYDRRKYAITVAMLPEPTYRHAFEPGCSVGVLTELLADRCERVTAVDVVPQALAATAERLDLAGVQNVALNRRSLDDTWPAGAFDLVVLSEVAYYLSAATLRLVLDRECGQLADGATVIASHWRHSVDDYPLTGDEADAVIAETSGLHRVASYVDDDVVISVFTKGAVVSVASRTRVPGAASVSPESA